MNANSSVPHLEGAAFDIRKNASYVDSRNRCLFPGLANGERSVPLRTPIRLSVLRGYAQPMVKRKAVPANKERGKG
jgi:hypothetical protein